MREVFGERLHYLSMTKAGESAEDAGQMSMFTEECEGMCGV